MKVSKILTVLAITSFITNFATAASEVKAPNVKYKDFPKEESGFINWIGTSTNIAVTPENITSRSERAFEALDSALTGVEGMGLKLFVKKSECVAWINLYRVSVLGGLRMGRGLASCRISPESNTWSAPFYLYTGQFSGGAQIGADQSDYFLFYPEKETLMNMINGNVTLSGSASITLAKGRSSAIGTDVDVKNLEIKKDFYYTYGVTRGVYAGIALEGGMLLSEDRYNDRAYNNILVDEILTFSSKKAPKATRDFSQLLEKTYIDDIDYDKVEEKSN
jgi:lipid-binding SYLF domain-containing protein